MIYRLRCGMSKHKSFAAELVAGLSGAAKRCAMQLTEYEFCPVDIDEDQMRKAANKPEAQGAIVAQVYNGANIQGIRISPTNSRAS